VGKNGTGKSTFLGSLANELIDNRSDKFYRQLELGFESYHKGNLVQDSHVDQVITVSTSPFDKFPLTRKSEDVDGYIYLGLRDLISSNFGLAYMSKIIGALIGSINQNPDQLEDITQVLNYLEYSGHISAKFKVHLSSNFINDLLRSDDPLKLFNKSFDDFNRYFSRSFFYRNEILDIDKFNYLLKILSEIGPYFFRRNFNLHISSYGITSEIGVVFNEIDIPFLIHSGVLRLRDIILEPYNGDHQFSIRDASSGEQSVILSILGIASHIKDNSLICIDEPEVCLHPQWQEKYIQLLISTFRSYKGCHFIIATHSPQIVSRLESHNCYILSMETGEVRNAKDYINNSVDFQLANIFNSPGFKNEYLTRIALNTFSKVSKKKIFDEEDTGNFRILEQQSGNLDQDDPILNLYEAIKVMREMYA
jgi:predicted ATPase